MAAAWLGNHYSAGMVKFSAARRFDGARRGTGLAKPVDQFRASDITFWGVFALVSWGVALIGVTLSAFIPAGVLGGLHSSRLEGANLNQLRGQMAALETEAAQLQRDNAVLLQRLALNEEASGVVMRRVGALELTVPQILDALSARGTGIDPGTTASTSTGPVVSFDVEGGSVSYTRTPMSTGSNVASVVQTMPEALPAIGPDSSAFGVALGPPIDANEGDDAWRSVNAKVGTLLVGLVPLLANVEGSSGKRLVLGPINTEADARQLCGQMAKVGIACASVPFIGEPMPLTN